MHYGVFMYVVHGHCGPLGPYPGPHTSLDPVVGSHIFAGPDGWLVGLVGLVWLVGSVVGFAFSGLDASFVGLGGLAFFLPAPRASSRCRSASFECGEEEGPGHLVEGGAARVVHPNGTALPPVDTRDGAPLYPGGVGYGDDRPDDRILRTVVLLLGTLGVVGLGGWGGFAVAVLGGLVGLGAGTAFVGRAVVVGGGGLGLLSRGIAPSSLSSDDSKENFCFLGAGWGGLECGFASGGGVWGGGGGRPPPSSPSLTPPPPMLPHIFSSSPPAYPTSCIRAHSLGRKWRDDTQMLLTTRAVSQSWRPRKRAMRWRAPKGTSWEPSASRQATRMGLAFVALTTTSITCTKKKCELIFSATFLIFRL